MADNVVPLRPRQRQAHLTCECGSTWWETLVCLERGVGGHYRVTGQKMPLKCGQCGKECTP